MKVVHIISGLTNGGAEAVLYRLCTKDTECTHIVISLSKGGMYAPMLRQSGIELYELNLSVRGGAPSLIKLFRLIRQIQPGVIQTWMYHADLIGGFVARLAGVRNIHWGIHSTKLDPKESPRFTAMLVRINAIASHFIPENIICCAQKSLEVHAEAGYAKNKLIVVNNGYDLSQFYIDCESGDAIRNEFALTSNHLLVGLVGRFNPQKDHKNLLQALTYVKKTYPQIKCMLAGPDLNASNQVLGGWIKDLQLNGNVVLLDQRNDVPAIMNALELHILSSAFGEAFPNVLNEAMACGTPCVTTDIGDAALIVGDTGWVVPPRDPKALAQAIVAALTERVSSDEIWRKRKIMALQRVEENFSIETMVDKYHAVWQAGMIAK